MSGFASSFLGGDDDLYDTYDTFVPDHVPDPGSFLEGHDVLTGADHLAVHRLARLLFEKRGVYDMTFGYNLARLNLDTRHTGAGFRYADDADEGGVLRAEFTPTTAFCPQSDTLTRGAFRAWNGLGEHHEYDSVRVRVDEMHHRAHDINETLTGLETDLENGTLDDGGVPSTPDTGGSEFDAPF